MFHTFDNHIIFSKFFINDKFDIDKKINDNINNEFYGPLKKYFEDIFIPFTYDCIDKFQKYVF